MGAEERRAQGAPLCSCRLIALGPCPMYERHSRGTEELLVHLLCAVLTEGGLLRCLQVARETWSLNGASYGAYRAFVAHAKEHGFPDIALAQLTQQLAQRGANDSAAERVEQSSGSAAASVGGLGGQPATAYGFAGALHSCYVSGAGEYLWSCKVPCVREGRGRSAAASCGLAHPASPGALRVLTCRPGSS